MATLGPSKVTFVQPVSKTEIEAVGLLKAEADLFRQVVEARSKLDNDRNKAGWPLVGHWYNHWYRQKYVLGRWAVARQRGSEANISNSWGVAKPFIEAIPMDRATAPAMQAIFRHMKEEEYSGQYQMRVYGTLNTMFMDAIRFGFDDGNGNPIWRARWNPMEAVKVPKKTAPADRVILSDKMLTEIIERSLDAHRCGPEVHFSTAAIALQALLGLRISEAVGLRWEQISLNGNIEGAAGIITWKTGQRKHGRPLIVPLPREALRFLPLNRREPSGRVWRSHGTSYMAMKVNEELRLRGLEMGIPSDSLSSHSLRHSFAFALMKEGADTATIQRALGHNSVKTTEIYLRSQEVVTAAAHHTARLVLPRAKLMLGGE